MSGRQQHAEWYELNLLRQEAICMSTLHGQQSMGDDGDNILGSILTDVAWRMMLIRVCVFHHMSTYTADCEESEGVCVQWLEAPQRVNLAGAYQFLEKQRC